MTEQAKSAPDELVEVFDKIISQYPDAERRQHSGYPAAFLNGNMVCGLLEDSMMIRLSERDRETFLKIKGASMYPVEEPEEEPEPEPEPDEADEADEDGNSDGNNNRGRNSGRNRNNDREDMSEYVMSPKSVTGDEAELDRWLGKSFTYVSTLPDRPRRGRSRPDRGNSIHADSGGRNNQRNQRNQSNRGRKKTSKKSASGGSRKKSSRKKTGQRRSRNRHSGSNQQQ